MRCLTCKYVLKGLETMMKKVAIGAVCVVIACGVLAYASEEWQSNPETKTDTSLIRDEARSVAAVLDMLHAAAAKADGKLYFKLFTDDAVFIGTDATERWTIAEFKDYAMKRFETGKGWTYT